MPATTRFGRRAHPDTPARSPVVGPHRPHLLTLAVVVVLAVSATGSYWLQHQRAQRAQAAFVRSEDVALALPSRIKAASAAVGLVPESVEYRQQEASLLARAYVEIGALDEARRLLIEGWALDRSNTEMRAQLRDVNLALQARDSWKAHVQHQREGPKGELDPEDVIP